MALQQNSLDCLINTIYPGLSEIPSNHHQDQFFMERTILSARNEEVDELNQKMLDPFAGEEIVFHSADTALTEEGLDNNFEYPTEFLNTVKASGLPLAKLCLKIGCPIMVLRNLDPSRGLCNGSRGILTRIQPHILEIRLLGGDYHGKCTFIPRTTITPTAAQVGLAMKRRQFPIRLAFAMTINKSQGQSVAYVGLDLRTDVFAHGQLYVALSRCTSSQRIKALLRRAETRTASNIVYPEVLLW
jgi:ATP-dependent exoDNAse (exonuclease V) alpha subunit